jgi:ABC-type transport system involved in cytochrome c biogenesis permease subunit
VDLVMERRLFAVSGAVVGFTAAVLAYYAPATVMHRDIGSVTPILRDNYWLGLHVVTIMASYASAAIAWILGNIALGYYLFGRYVTESRSNEEGGNGGTALQLTHPAIRQAPEACSVLARFIYTAIQITVLLLAAGTILGALWADKAWGHFWGWDPKEVWALISLLAYILILHTRYLGWSHDFGMALAAVLGFTAILFTWYGVNFVLGSGMHSYGSGAGGAWAVTTAVVIQWLILFAAWVRRRMEVIEQP